MTVHIPLWLLWFVPILIGVGFVVFSKDESGAFLTLPGAGCFIGFAIIAATICAALGFALAAWVHR